MVNKTENSKKLLTGIFLIIIGVFMPWYVVSTAYAFNMPGIMEGINTSLIPGYSTVPGIAILITAVVMLILVFVPAEGKDAVSRIFTALVFLAALTGALFFIGGVIPAFIYLVDAPHIGLLSILTGCVLVLLALKQDYVQFGKTKTSADKQFNSE